jgi:hypothetical protein
MDILFVGCEGLEVDAVFGISYKDQGALMEHGDFFVPLVCIREQHDPIDYVHVFEGFMKLVVGSVSEKLGDGRIGAIEGIVAHELELDHGFHELGTGFCVLHEYVGLGTVNRRHILIDPETNKICRIVFSAEQGHVRNLIQVGSKDLLATSFVRYVKHVEYDWIGSGMLGDVF